MAGLQITSIKDVTPLPHNGCRPPKEEGILIKSTVAKGKLVRKFGENIFGNPKYDRLLNRKPYTPGQHGQSRRSKLSNYGIQLKRNKNKVYVWAIEKQFRLTFERLTKC